MITLTLDNHDFLAAVEGFARGSHLRQHVWDQIVYRSIVQMSDDDLDFLWFYLRRNLWKCYFFNIDGKPYQNPGHEDYRHALAALHRGNRYKVKFRADKAVITALCYRFDGHFRPLQLLHKRKHLESYNSFIPDEWVINYTHLPMPKNEYVEQGKEQWWNDLTVYSKDTPLPDSQS